LVTLLSDAALAHLREVADWPVLPERYACLRRAGRGGSATVYEARDRDLDRVVAVKVLDVPDRAGRAATRLAREALILARLDHPGIVPIHEHGTLADGRAFYVMKFVKGRPIDEAAAARSDVLDRLALFDRVLETVAFAHARGIVHRDLKPSNILVGEFGEVFVMDWGAAQLDDVPEAEAVIAGTPGFMAPEQAIGGRVDPRADIHALGAVLLTMAAAARSGRGCGEGERVERRPPLSRRAGSGRGPPSFPHRSRPDRPPRIHRRAPAAPVSPLRAADPAGCRLHFHAGDVAGLAGHLTPGCTGSPRRVEQNLRRNLMKKPVFAMLLGGVLGVFDGLSALISAPQEAPNIVGIVIGSTVKGVIVGLIVGLVARRTRSMAVGVVTGVAVGALLAYLVTIGGPYLWEIVLPGSAVGLIVGIATMKYRGQ
jgi:aminoglycoside phosphotransferase (APT) family kinase protein